MANDPIDLSAISTESELSLVDQSIGIMSHLLQRHNNKEELDRMSIDKTDSVLRIIDTATKITNQQSTLRLRLMSQKSESEDRDRLLTIIQSQSLRDTIRSESNKTELTDEDIAGVDLPMARGELTEGIEQLNLDALEIEKELTNV